MTVHCNVEQGAEQVQSETTSFILTSLGWPFGPHCGLRYLPQLPFWFGPKSEGLYQLRSV